MSYRYQSPSPAPGVPTNADDRSAAFKPVDGASQMQSGEKLLVEAYAAIWLILFVGVLLSWRKQRGIEGRIAGLEAAVAKARGEAPPAEKGGA